MTEGNLGVRPRNPQRDTRDVVSPSRVKRALFALVTLFLIFAIAALGLEVLLRLLDRARPIVSGWRAVKNASTRFQHNQLGFRGFPIQYSDDDFVVVLVGDSQVEAAACSYYWLPERQLEHHLTGARSVRVFSVGASGWGQDQELLALREYYEKFRADLVVVWETPGNDLWNNTFPTGDPQGRRPKPTFWIEDGVLRGPTSHIDDVISPPFRLGTMFQRLFVSWDRQWERHLPAPYVPLSDYRGPVKQTWQSLWDQKLGNISSDDMVTEKNHQTLYLTPRSPRTQYSIDLTRRLLEEMSREARAHGGSFMTFYVDGPNLEVDLDDNEEAVFVLNNRYYRLSERQKDQNLIDIDAGFENYVLPLPPGEWRVSPTDGHLSEHGVDEVMRQLAQKIVASQPANFK